MLIFPLSMAAGAEPKGALCLCERGERQPVCLSGRVCAGVYVAALTAMEGSAGPGCLGHAPHHGLHLHLLQPNHLALGPGKLPPQQVSERSYIFFTKSKSLIFCA